MSNSNQSAIIAEAPRAPIPIKRGGTARGELHPSTLATLAAPHQENAFVNIHIVDIEGEVLSSLFDHHLFEMADTSVLHQGTARYRWDGEEAIGLIERCTLKARIAS